jgi:hypothetical protein
MAVVTFSLQQSDWPLRISFPIVLQNLLHYLAPGLALGAANVTAGQHVTLFPAPGARAIQVVRPDGSTDLLRPPFAPFTDTSRPGLYTVREVGSGPSSGTAAHGGSNSAQASFAVNFFPARPAPAAGPAVLHLGHTQTGASRTTSVPVSVAWAFGLLALALLGVEWWAAFRSH